MIGSASSPGSRNAGLDLLRLVAVVLVLGRHLALPEGACAWLTAWQRGGWVGVDLFFVLSGFLVSGLLFREHRETGSVRAGRFLIRRAFRIYPPFWLLLAATLLVLAWRGGPLPVRSVCGEIFFLQNYLGGLWPHTWSLAVEEHFYAGIALLVVWLQARRRTEPFAAIPGMFAAVAGTCFALRLLTAVVKPEYSARWDTFATHIRMDSLFFGVLLSWLWHYRSLEHRMQRVPAAALWGLGAVLLSPAFVFTLERDRWVPVAGVVLFYAGSGCWLMAALRLRGRNAILRTGAALGAASYSIYLWHMPVHDWLAAGWHRRGEYAAYAVTYLGGACAAGWLLHRLLERPVLRLRDRFFPSLEKHPPTPG